METTRTILYAEDDHDDLLILREALRRAKLDYKVNHVHDGRTAIDWLDGYGIYKDRERFPLPDLFLTDLEMARGAGITVIQWIRDQPQFDKMPVVITSSFEKVEDIKEAARLRVDGFFQKAPGFPRLIEFLRETQKP